MKKLLVVLVLLMTGCTNNIQSVPEKPAPGQEAKFYHLGGTCTGMCQSYDFEVYRVVIDGTTYTIAVTQHGGIVKLNEQTK